MSQKLFTFLILMCFICTVNTSFSNDRHRLVRVVSNGDALRGDTGPIHHGPPAPNSTQPLQGPITYSVNNLLVTGSEVSLDARTHYDLQSNGVINYICQEPNNPQNISAIFYVRAGRQPLGYKKYQVFLFN